MSEFFLRSIVFLLRAWTRLYTTGVTPALRDRRRAEIESDIWESCQEPNRRSLAWQMLRRLAFGVHDDLAWRNSCRTPSWLARMAFVAAMVATILAAGLLFSFGRTAVLPAPAPLVHQPRALPPPPPPPPPPCPPPALAPSPTPCVP
jgi:hypothetical protein